MSYPFIFGSAPRCPKYASFPGFRSIKPQLSQPGEIRKEYETQLDVFRKELEIERQNELKATSAYIAKIIAEGIRKHLGVPA